MRPHASPKRVLPKDMLSQPPGLPVGRMGNPRSNSHIHVLPLGLAGVELRAKTAQLAAKPDHVVPDKPRSFWKYPPAQKGHAFPCAVHAAFRWVHPQPQAAHSTKRGYPGLGQFALLPTRRDRLRRSHSKHVGTAQEVYGELRSRKEARLGRFGSNSTSAPLPVEQPSISSCGQRQPSSGPWTCEAASRYCQMLWTGRVRRRVVRSVLHP